MAVAAGPPLDALGTLAVVLLAAAGARVPPTDMPPMPDEGGITDFFIFTGRSWIVLEL